MVASRTEPAEARAAATRVVQRLRSAGHEAFFAGGCVRDELLGGVPEDYDVATDAVPDRVGDLFRGSRGVGKAFGVMLVRDGGVTIEVATFRQEQGYSDSRRPDAVTFCDARSDAQRRDFTINALFIDPLDTRERPGGKVIDFVGGLGDMRSRLIRAVGDADERLHEDHLRGLRAVRFAARFASLGFSLEATTRAAVARHARALRGVSRERIGDELRRMLAGRGGAGRVIAATLLQELGLDGPSLDEPSLPGAPLVLLKALDDEAPFAAALAAWAVDRERARVGVGSVRVADGAGMSARYRRALCLSNDEHEALHRIIDGAGQLEAEWGKWGVAARKRAAAADWFGTALALVGAHDAGLGAAISGDVRTLAATPGGLAPTPFITGDDLVAAGLEPGPRFKQWLAAVYDAQLEGRVTGAAEAMAFVRRLEALEAGPASTDQ